MSTLVTIQKQIYSYRQAIDIEKQSLSRNNSKLQLYKKHLAEVGGKSKCSLSFIKEIILDVIEC